MALNLIKDLENKVNAAKLATFAKYGIQGDPTSLEFWQNYKSLPPAQQQKILASVQAADQATGGHSGAMKDGQEGYLSAAFKAGVQLPGVSASGQGTGLSPAEIARSQQAGAIETAKTAQAGVSQNQGDYSVTPTLESSVDPLTGQLKMLDPAAQLQHDQQTDAINQTRTDTTGVDAQKQALGQYSNVINSGGLTDIDRASIEQSRARNAQVGRAQGQAIMSDAAEQGRAGGTASTVARLQAQQAATNNRSNDLLQTNAMALSRKDAATGALASTGASIQSSQDAIDNFNTAGERQRISDNLARVNAAHDATYNEQNRRDSANQATTNMGVVSDHSDAVTRNNRNVDRANAAEAYNKGPSGGRRGLDATNLQAAGIPINALQTGSSQEAGFQHDIDAAEAQKTAALYGTLGGLGSSVLGAGIDALQPKKGQ